MIKKINYSTAIKQATFSAMELDKNVIVYGLGVGHSSNIYGTTKGLKEKFGKDRVFDAFCWHYDDTETLPSNAKILASNQKSEVQSVTFDINDSNIWAVQYHPELDPLWIAGLMKQREEIFKILKDWAYEKTNKKKRKTPTKAKNRKTIYCPRL